MVQIPSQKLTPHMHVHTPTCMCACLHMHTILLLLSLYPPLPKTASEHSLVWQEFSYPSKFQEAQYMESNINIKRHIFKPSASVR